MESIPTTTALSRSEPTRRAAEPLRIAGFAIAVGAIELLLARGIVQPEISRYVFLFVGLFAVALVFRFPMATALVFFGFTDFIFYPTYFAQEIGSLSVRPHELALACLLLVALVRPARKTWGGVPGTALAVFLGIVLVSALLALQSGAASLTDAFAWGRPLGLLTFFYVVVRLFPTPEQRRLLLTGAAVLAAVTGVVAAAVSIGYGFGLDLQEAGGQLIREGEGGSIDRVRLAGLSAGYALFWFCAVQIASQKGNARFFWTALLLGITLDIGVSLNRNMWLGLFFGALLMAVFGGAVIRNRMAAGAAVAVAGLAILMFFGSSTGGDDVVQPLIKRGSTILNPGKTEKESSLQERAQETDEAWAVAKDHLVVGVGTGAPFGVYTREAIFSGNFIIGATVIPQLFLHNQYLYLILIAGIPGLIAFLIFLGAPVLHAVRRVPRDPPITACGIGIALIMISSVVAIYFTVEDMTAVLGLLAGVLVADAEGRAADGEPSGLLP